jgi:predicted small secreted protein
MPERSLALVLLLVPRKRFFSMGWRTPKPDFFGVRLMIKNLLLAMILAVSGISMVACESTGRGLSRDMDRAGDKIEDAADDAGDAMEEVADDLD